MCQCWRNFVQTEIFQEESSTKLTKINIKNTRKFRMLDIKNSYTSRADKNQENGCPLTCTAFDTPQSDVV